MPLRLPELQDRFRAAVLGFAIGDALGFPYRGLPPTTSQRTQGLAEDFAPKPRGKFAKGQFSDDTQVLLAALGAVSRHSRIDGAQVAAHYSWLWQEGVILLPPANATASAQSLLRGTPWMGAGAPLGIREPSCLSRGVVAGLWSDDTSTKLAHDAAVLTVSTHKDPVCTAGVVAIARAIQLGLRADPMAPAAFCEEVAKAASAADQEFADEVFFLPRVLGWAPERAFPSLRKVGVPVAVLEASPGIPPHVTPVVLSALYAFLRLPHDFRGALELLLNLGGEVDVAAGLCASIFGAHTGCDAMPARLKKNLLYGEDVVESADRLFDAKLARTLAPAPVLRRRR